MQKTGVPQAADLLILLPFKVTLSIYFTALSRCASGEAYGVRADRKAHLLQRAQHAWEAWRGFWGDEVVGWSGAVCKCLEYFESWIMGRELLATRSSHGHLCSWVTRQITRPNTNNGTWKWWFQKGTSSRTIIFRFRVSFWGCRWDET